MMFRREGDSQSYYDILKIQPDSSNVDVRNAYLEMARIYHPDNNPGNKRIAALRFRLINEAYAAVKTREGRARYNKLLLLRQGHPKGMKLQADNDNRRLPHQNNGLWDSLLDFFMPTKSAHKLHHSPQKD